MYCHTLSYDHTRILKSDETQSGVEIDPVVFLWHNFLFSVTGLSTSLSETCNMSL